MWTSGRGCPAPRSMISHDVVVGERLRAGELVAGALRGVAVAAARSSAAITQSATSSAQIGWKRAWPAPTTGTAGSSASRDRIVWNGSPGA